MKVQHLKNEFKKILTRYVQYKYTFFSRNRFIHAYLMICIQTVKMLGAKQKYGIQNIQKQSEQAEVLLSILEQLGEPSKQGVVNSYNEFYFKFVNESKAFISF